MINGSNQIKAALQKVVDSGELAGAATLVWRDHEAQTVCVGWREIESNLPVERDTIFRIASMTKPITSVAALMLVEEGRIAAQVRHPNVCTLRWTKPIPWNAELPLKTC